eukprot:COSAG01_NODE_2673_length_7266_cov_24.715920_3_plen_165_part_00
MQQTNCRCNNDLTTHSQASNYVHRCMASVSAYSASNQAHASSVNSKMQSTRMKFQLTQVTRSHAAENILSSAVQRQNHLANQRIGDSLTACRCSELLYTFDTVRRHVRGSQIRNYSQYHTPHTNIYAQNSRHVHYNSISPALSSSAVENQCYHPKRTANFVPQS